MKTGITQRLFLAMLTSAGLAVVSLVLIMQWNLNRGFLSFINTMEKNGVNRLAASLEKSYAAELGWNFLRRDPARWREMVAVSRPQEEVPPPDGIPPAEGRPQRYGLPPGPPLDRSAGDSPPPPRTLALHMAGHFDQRLFLLDADKNVLISLAEIPAASDTTPLRHEGRIVGYLGLLPRTTLSDPPQLRFLREQRLVFTLVAGLVVLLAAVLAVLLAKRLVRPLQDLAQATHQLTKGTYTVRVAVTSDDELGRLATDFNALAVTLEQNEQARRQWVADISHELRTPLAILRGEIEALQDGIRQPSTESIHSLHGEVLRLSRLVEDLYQLSLSDIAALTYRSDELDLGDVLSETIATFRSEFSAKGIELAENIDRSGSAEMVGDAERIHQLFFNLMDNSLKYTDSGGTLQIDLQLRDGQAVVDFQDSAPGVPLSSLDRLFDRLYRVDSSRNRSTGGAGLGLAICRGIVDAHSGTITARPSALGGLWIRVEFPLERN